MSVNTQEQHVKEDNRTLKKEWTAHFKRALNFCFRNIVSPGNVSESIVIFSSYLAISLIFVLDVISDPVNSFHLLYIFPLTFIAMHSSRTKLVTGAVALSISLQVCELLFLQDRIIEIPVNLFFLIAFSNIICALIARHSRTYVLEIKRLSTIDPLTQLCNRRGLDKAMEMEVVRQRRYGGHLSLAVLDLDGFKGLNDTMGHKAGDKALILLADILRKQIRKTDSIARLGGDEFVVLMPNTDASDCNALCHLLCHTIRLMLTEVLSYPLSVSIGFTSITTSENLTEVPVYILSIADKALYRAKELGKDCVVRGYAEELTEK
jgi:diguanylate cyclase (GGDEF)-like protein